jgi:hypothetical protein
MRIRTAPAGLCFHKRFGAIPGCPLGRPAPDKAGRHVFRETIMHWLRNWFRGDRTATTTRAHTARPALEKLEDRCTPSLFGAVSSVNDSFGNNSLFDVHQNGTLFFQYASQPNVLITSEGTDVKSVSAGTDNQDHVDALVVHNNGNLTMHNASQLAGYAFYGLPDTPALLSYGVKSVVAEDKGRALVIDNQNFLWMYDPNQTSFLMPVKDDGSGSPEFPGEPTLPLGFPPYWGNFRLLDVNVSQATLLRDKASGNDTVIALHRDGTLTSDLVLQVPVSTPNGGTGPHQVNNPLALGNIVSISSSDVPGSTNANALYTVGSNGDLQEFFLTGPLLLRQQDFGNAGGAGFKDVSVGTSNDWVAVTNTNQVYRDGQLISPDVGPAASAFAGPSGSFYEVTTSGTLYQWSPQPHSVWVQIYTGRTLRNPSGYTWEQALTNWTELDSGPVSTN